MTWSAKSHNKSATGKQQSEKGRSSKTTLALKRYLDLTLTGTKKALAEHGSFGRRDIPPSPYSFDKPEIENTIRTALQSQTVTTKHAETAPRWVENINRKICKHSGEAPIFSENLLPPYKLEQTRPSESRPLSGISTKSAPVFINGEMYYRPNKKHDFLHASSRPSSAKEERATRASVLRNRHRTQAMSAVPSNDTQVQLRRLRAMKPKLQQLNRDLLPIPCHVGETPNSFIIGARYNCSNFMDSRSYARLGLYLSRKNPQNSFLRIYRGQDYASELENDSDFVGNTSARPGGGSGKSPDGYTSKHGKREDPWAPKPYIKKVVKEAWLKEGLSSGTETTLTKPSRSNKHSSANSSKRDSRKAKSPSMHSQQPKSSRNSRTSVSPPIDIRGHQAPTNETGSITRLSRPTSQAETH